MVSLIAGFNNSVTASFESFGATLVQFQKFDPQFGPGDQPRPRDAPEKAADLRGRHRAEGALPVDAVGVAGALLVPGQQRQLGPDGQLRRRRGESRHHRRGGLRLPRRQLQADRRGPVHQRDRRAALGAGDRHRLRHRRRDLPVRRPDRQVGAVRRPALRGHRRDGRAGRDDVRVDGRARLPADHDLRPGLPLGREGRQRRQHRDRAEGSAAGRRRSSRRARTSCACAAACRSTSRTTSAS